MKPLIAPLGRCYWAVAPFAPEPPFRVYAGTERPPFEVADANTMKVAASRGGGSEFTLLTSVKPRPVLVVTAPLEPYNEVVALRLKRLNTLSDADAERVRQYQDNALFYLKPDAFKGLELENAAIVTSMLRLPMSAIDTTIELGTIDENELRVLHERIVDAHELRLEVPILRKAQELQRKINSLGD